MVTILTTGELNLPDQQLDPWLKSVADGSSVAALSGSIPMKFGKGETMVFDSGEAEYVGEGANKGPSDITSKVQTIEPFKFHKTVRWTQEVMWADEDYQLGVVDQILATIQPALSRALDFGVYHGINPINGTAVAAMTQKLDDVTNSVTAGQGTPVADIDAAVGLVLATENTPSGIALDPSYAAGFLTARNADQVKLFPDFKPTTAPSTLDGWTSSTSRTVDATGVMNPPPGVAAYVGDFTAIRWGIQRQIGLELIEYGDPDGQGDLKRNNQVAFRAEVVYGWGIAELEAFAKIMAGTAPAG